MTHMENARAEPGALTAGRRVKADHTEGTRKPQLVRRGVAAVIRDRDRTRRIIVTGRQAWALGQLVSAGSRGCTPILNPGPRWSSYVQRLRAKGLDIETRRETHGGPFAGQHGIYILHSDVTLEPWVEA